MYVTCKEKFVENYVVFVLEYANLRCILPPRPSPENIKGLVEKLRRRADSPVNHRVTPTKDSTRSTEE